MIFYHAKWYMLPYLVPLLCIQKVIPYVGVAIGVLLILRGLGLGISYVSPSNMSLFVQEKPIVINWFL
jgi:hypothetical protein